MELILSLLGFVLGIVWLVFPFLVLGKLNKMIQLAEVSNRELEIIRHVQSKQDRAMPSE